MRSALSVVVCSSEAPTSQIRRRFPPSGAKMGRTSNAAKVPDRDPARSENGCSTHGLDDASPETRAATLAMRADWKFFAVHSFCHTFRAVLRLPEFTAAELERSLIDPTSDTVIIEILLRLLEDVPNPGPRVFVDEWESRLLRLVEIVAEESDAFEDAYPSNHDADPPAYGHPLRGGRTLFDLTPHERLDLVHVLCEDALDREEGACASEAAAMARDHAMPTSDAFGGHPEAHGDAAGFDSDGRAYYVCGKDVRVYAWEKPSGKGWKEPGFATVCASAAECRRLAESLSGKKSGKDKALREYLLEQHLPPHDAEEEKVRRAARAAEAREEERAIRAASKAKYDALDRKRSGRIAMKIAEDAERRRKEEEEAEARAEVEAIVAAREEARQTACWRWMLLPPRLRPAEVPEGMNPETSDAALAAAAAETAEAAALSGEASVGRYVKIHWDADGAWYDAKVESHDAETGQHTVRYLADDAVETLDLDGERKRWMPESAYVTPSGRRIPLAEPEPPGLEYRGVRMEGKGATTLCARRPRAEGAEDAEGPVGDGTRKAHSCRACAERGVLATDHAKFSRACPFHPEYKAKAKEPAEATVEEPEEMTVEEPEEVTVEEPEEKAVNGTEPTEEKAVNGTEPTEGAADGMEPEGANGAAMDVDAPAEDDPVTIGP